MTVLNDSTTIVHGLDSASESFDYSLRKALMRSPISGILILYTFIAAWFIGGLMAFHFYLILSNQVSIRRQDESSQPGFSKLQ
ncbi:hypothetical protein MLD38_003366 [Melastoma candidum]|uniref:Uncharacterized protein n=1 Tax=Melastoma candidum TaxID=119954 RepID=A0ACB9S5I2_9MYRT|nr:hypothetical protein MLD38_003366 [Melastoma candidum]